MRKQRIHIERELQCKSMKIIWPLLSTPEGLAKWIADDVKRSGHTFTFQWGELWSNHEIRQATMTEELTGHHVRLVWEGDDPQLAFWELALERSDITGDYILLITDFALPEDADDLKDIWEQNLEQLHHATGL